MKEGESERRRRFDVLFACYSSDIVAYCGWRAQSSSDAQDAAAEVFLTAWRRLDELPEGDAARVWLYATARRVLASQRRSSRRRAALYERLALDATSQGAPEGPDRGSWWSTGSSTASAQSTAAGSGSAARSASTPVPGRPPTSTSTPCVRTSAA
jgi:DNA-directed RNA polymerase specialized sigma24 family protein